MHRLKLWKASEGRFTQVNNEDGCKNRTQSKHRQTTACINLQRQVSEVSGADLCKKRQVWTGTSTNKQGATLETSRYAI